MYLFMERVGKMFKSRNVTSFNFQFILKCVYTPIYIAYFFSLSKNATEKLLSCGRCTAKGNNLPPSEARLPQSLLLVSLGHTAFPK